MSKSVLQCHTLCKTFHQGENAVVVLDKVEMTVTAGEKIAILGASGSGKSTLLHILGGLDKPDSGTLNIDGQDILAMKDAPLSRFRNQHIGFVYQFHHLLPEFNALENVSIPLWMTKISKTEAKVKAEAILDKVGLSHRLNHRPAQLSGGERQRVAIARAMVNTPSLILADEPTGNLDGASVQNILDIFNTLNHEHGTALVVVTHDQRIATEMDRVVTLENHRLV
jgi:lipoprotein-releasing system ATP-binding protein